MSIFHLTTPEQWQLAQNLGYYSTPSLSKEGFIHASTQEQVSAIANTFYSNFEELILLVIDPGKLQADLKWESPSHPHPNLANESLNSLQFPHIYGTINLDAVTRIISLHKDSDGLFTIELA